MARCKACGVELRQGARFCDMCGTKVEKICPSCGETLRDQAKFCDLCGVKLYTDYGHNPAEMHSALANAVRQPHKTLWAVMQPHTYSRTKALFNDFIRQLKRPDIVYLAEIFAAREKNTLGISSKDLADRIDGARFYKTFGEIVASLRETAQPGDIILTVGAGNVYKIGEQLLEDDYE